MEDQRAPIQFRRSDHAESQPRPIRQVVAVVAHDAGPYEMSYTISNGYPDREVVLP